jgi:ribosomal RNA-processing protein 9
MEAKRKLEKKKLVQNALAKKKAAAFNGPSVGSTITDVVDQSTIVKSLGDHINTRMQEIDYDDEIDEAEFEERSRALKAEAAEKLGNAHRDLRSIASQLVSNKMTPLFVGHNRNSITCCAQIDDLLWYGDKTGAVYSYSLVTHEKRFMTPTLGGEVLSIAISDTRGFKANPGQMDRSTVDHSCPSYVAAGSGDGNIHIWKTFTLEYLGALKLHRTGVTGLAFRAGSSSLYSCSLDSTVRVWAVAEMLAVDRLFGHLGPALAIASLRKERAVTGGMDRSVRYWKIEAGSQVEYASVGAPTECVAMLNDDTLVAGSANGLLAVYDVGKLNPLCSVPAAHGSGDCGDGTGLEKEALASYHHTPRENAVRNGNGIMALAAPSNGNIIATGSYDGVVRLWEFVPRSAGGAGKEPTPAQLIPLGTIPLTGVIASMSFSADAKRLVIVTAKEPRLGRWVTRSDCLNGIYVFPVGGLKNAPAASTVADNATRFAPRKDAVKKVALVVPSRKPATTETEENETVADRSVDDEEQIEDEDDDGIPDEDDLFAVGEHGQLILKSVAKKAETRGDAKKQSSAAAAKKSGASEAKAARVGKMKDRNRVVKSSSSAAVATGDKTKTKTMRAAK